MLKWNQEQMRWKWFFIALAVLPDFFFHHLVSSFFEGASNKSQQCTPRRSNEFIVMMITSGDGMGRRQKSLCAEKKISSTRKPMNNFFLSYSNSFLCKIIHFQFFSARSPCSAFFGVAAVFFTFFCYADILSSVRKLKRNYSFAFFLSLREISFLRSSSFFSSWFLVVRKNFLCTSHRIWISISTRCRFISSSWASQRGKSGWPELKSLIISISIARHCRCDAFTENERAAKPPKSDKERSKFFGVSNFNLFPLHDSRRRRRQREEADDGTNKMKKNKGSSNLIFSDAAILPSYSCFFFAEKKLLVVLLSYTLSHNYANTLGKIHFIIASRVAFALSFSSSRWLYVRRSSARYTTVESRHLCRCLSTSSSLFAVCSLLLPLHWCFLISILFCRAVVSSS